MSTVFSDLDKMRRLLLTRQSCVAINTADESYALGVLKNVCMEMGLNLYLWSVTEGLRSGIVADSGLEPDTEHPAAALYHCGHRMFLPAVCVMLDLGPHLTDERTLRSLRDCLDVFRESESTMVLVDSSSDLPGVIRSEAADFEIALPNDATLERIVRQRLKELRREPNVEIRITKRVFSAIIRNLRGLTRGQVKRVVTEVVADDLRFDDADLNHVMAAKRKALKGDGLLEFVETPTDLSEIGGLRRLKSWLRQRHRALDDEARAFGISPPRGVLLLGVQGVGKSLCAKAIATAWGRPLLRMDPGALYDRYIGESEKRLRDSLRQAEQMAPIVLWIDEIEKGFAAAASRSTDGGLSQRMFGTLLTWMQEHEAPVFMVATANDIEALPPELLRKGRFDEIFFVDLPDAKTRRVIFQIHLAKRDRDPAAFDLKALGQASEGFSGAEIEQAVIAALYDAFAGKSEVETEHILKAISMSPPLSVTMAERIAELREWGRERCTPAD